MKDSIKPGICQEGYAFDAECLTEKMRRNLEKKNG